MFLHFLEKVKAIFGCLHVEIGLLKKDLLDVELCFVVICDEYLILYVLKQFPLVQRILQVDITVLLLAYLPRLFEATVQGITHEIALAALEAVATHVGVHVIGLNFGTHRRIPDARVV